MKNLIKQIFSVIPFKTKILSFLYKFKSFPGSGNYWEKRYLSGGDSGAGSYQELSLFKAKIINNFILNENVESVIEFGCGDGNQLKLMDYKKYLGIDISPTIISKCKKLFSKDKSKSFLTYQQYKNQSAELSLSLDVIYHLVEDKVYEDHLKKVFDSSHKFVIIYSSDFESNNEWHVRHRKFTRWIEKNRNDFELIKKIKNEYPFMGDNNKGSFSDFFIYSKRKT